MENVQFVFRVTGMDEEGQLRLNLRPGDRPGSSGPGERRQMSCYGDTKRRNRKKENVLLSVAFPSEPLRRSTLQGFRRDVRGRNTALFLETTPLAG